MVDNEDYRNELVALASKPMGGEMEAAGLYVAAQETSTHWIIVKAVCDYADGNKGEDKEAHQKLAATRAVDLVLHTIEQGGFAATRSNASGRKESRYSEPTPSAPEAIEKGRETFLTARVNKETPIISNNDRSTVFLEYFPPDGYYLAHRIYFDLLSRGFRVWLQDYEVKAGDDFSLAEEGILQSCSCAILLLSNNMEHIERTVYSIDQILERENRECRKMLIPIRLSRYASQSKIKGRVVVDFSDSYSEGLHDLILVLGEFGLPRRLTGDHDNFRVPISLPNGYALDKDLFRLWENNVLRNLPDSYTIKPDQIIFSKSQIEDKLRRKIHKQIDDTYERESRWGWYPRENLKRVNEDEIEIRHGVAEILNRKFLSGKLEPYSSIDALFWFIRGWRSNILRSLHASQLKYGEVISYGEECKLFPCPTREMAEDYFCDDMVHSVAQPLPQGGMYEYCRYKLWLPTDSLLLEKRRIPQRDGGFQGAGDVSKYLIPYMVDQWYRFQEEVPWDAEGFKFSRD